MESTVDDSSVAPDAQAEQPRRPAPAADDEPQPKASLFKRSKSEMRKPLYADFPSCRGQPVPDEPGTIVVDDALMPLRCIDPVSESATVSTWYELVVVFSRRIRAYLNDRHASLYVLGFDKAPYVPISKGPEQCSRARPGMSPDRLAELIADLDDRMTNPERELHDDLPPDFGPLVADRDGGRRAVIRYIVRSLLHPYSPIRLQLAPGTHLIIDGHCLRDAHLQDLADKMRWTDDGPHAQMAFCTPGRVRVDGQRPAGLADLPTRRLPLHYECPEGTVASARFDMCASAANILGEADMCPFFYAALMWEPARAPAWREQPARRCVVALTNDTDFMLYGPLFLERRGEVSEDDTRRPIVAMVSAGNKPGWWACNPSGAAALAATDGDVFRADELAAALKHRCYELHVGRDLRRPHVMRRPIEAWVTAMFAAGVTDYTDGFKFVTVARFWAAFFLYPAWIGDLAVPDARTPGGMRPRGDAYMRLLIAAYTEAHSSGRLVGCQPADLSISDINEKLTGLAADRKMPPPERLRARLLRLTNTMAIAWQMDVAKPELPDAAAVGYVARDPGAPISYNNIAFEAEEVSVVRKRKPRTQSVDGAQPQAKRRRGSTSRAL